MSRDTQFAGFAKLLQEEIADTVVWVNEPAAKKLQAIIARRAYDLAYHVMSETSVQIAAYNEGGEVSRQENMQYIPDLTRWPEEVHDGSS